MIDKFMEEYTRFEENVRKLLNKSVYEYENAGNHDKDYVEKIKLCRVIRNYVAHQKDGKDFVGVSKEMLSFLKVANEEFERQYEHVKDRLKRVKAVTKDNTLEEVARTLKNNPFAVFVDDDKNVLGVFSNSTVTNLVGRGIKPRNKIKPLASDKEFLNTKGDYYFAKEDDRLSLYHRKNQIVVVDDKERYKGIVSW